jgi:beta-phosphoglucomutase-like phosphatase (HAD superfamily)
MPLPERAPEVVLLDADGNLFPSEEPAFAASCQVTNAFLAWLGSEGRFDATSLQELALGRNFRAMALQLADDAGVRLAERDLARWVAREQEAVTEHLGRVLRPDPLVTEIVQALHERCRLAVVSSSALARLDACLQATGLAQWLPAEVRYSAQDSLPSPTSKPDPAVYVAALAAMGAQAPRAVAVEDAVAGVRSAVGAGVPVVGNLAFVPEDQRVERERQLIAAGAEVVVAGWRELGVLIGAGVAAHCQA